jgi:preprotein translocase subunit SecE
MQFSRQKIREICYPSLKEMMMMIMMMMMIIIIIIIIIYLTAIGLSPRGSGYKERGKTVLF